MEVSFFKNNLKKNLDLSCKMDLDCVDCFGFIAGIYKTGLDILGHSRKWKIPFYSQINTVYKYTSE